MELDPYWVGVALMALIPVLGIPALAILALVWFERNVIDRGDE
jgi:hypothetical protein